MDGKVNCQNQYNHDVKLIFDSMPLRRLSSFRFNDLANNPNYFKALKELSIEENQVTVIPTTIQQLTNLERLNVQGNPIDQASSEMLKAWLSEREEEEEEEN